MEDLNKRLVEVECVLQKLVQNDKEKIPQKVWDYIENNKDSKYIFEYNDSKSLEEQNLNIDTIAILTQINMEYLLDENEKKEMKKLLKQDEQYLEQQKRKEYEMKYGSNEIFKKEEQSNTNKTEEKAIAKIDEKNKWYQKIISFFKKIKFWR